MKTIHKINLKELQGVELQRPEMKFLVGGCGSDGSITCTSCERGILSPCVTWSCPPDTSLIECGNSIHTGYGNVTCVRR